MNQAPIPHKTQRQAVKLMTDLTLAQIEDLFIENDLPPADEGTDESRWPIRESVRRRLASQHHEAIDFDDPLSRPRLLRVYDELLTTLGDSPEKEAFIASLERDGVKITNGRIAPAKLELPEATEGVSLNLEDLHLVRDPEVLRLHARRMGRALTNQDPEDAILCARELVESTCKMIIEHYGEIPPKNASLGKLYNQAAELLALRAKDIKGDDEASKASRQVLQGLSSVADGLGLLRNRVGRGHGRTAKSPARQRHAELATNAASALALFLLDTWHDREATGD